MEKDQARPGTSPRGPAGPADEPDPFNLSSPEGNVASSPSRQDRAERRYLRSMRADPDTVEFPVPKGGSRIAT